MIKIELKTLKLIIIIFRSFLTSPISVLEFLSFFSVQFWFLIKVVSYKKKRVLVYADKCHIIAYIFTVGRICFFYFWKPERPNRPKNLTQITVQLTNYMLSHYMKVVMYDAWLPHHKMYQGTDCEIFLKEWQSKKTVDPYSWVLRTSFK